MPAPQAAYGLSENLKSFGTLGRHIFATGGVLRPNANGDDQTQLASAGCSFYDLTAKDAEGNDVDFELFKDKVVFVINVASR